MPVVFSLQGARGLAKAGVPADAPAGAPAGEYSLTLQRILNLVNTPELFFELNPLFAPLRDAVDRALKTLLEAGIITQAGQKPVRRGGCGGCARRKLLSFGLQFAAHFQTVVLRAQQDPALRQQLEHELRAYICRKDPNELPESAPLVIYAREKTGAVRRVIL